MLSFLGQPQRACDGPTRREMLRIGGLGALGLCWPELAGARTSRPGEPSFGRAKACILIYLFGGPSQLETFDLKPDAPLQFRGEFRPIATNVPGLSISEHLPRLARVADKFTLLRGMNHEHPRHGWGLYYMLTGHKHSRPDLDAPPTPDDFPGIGAVVNKLGRSKPGVPPAITYPRWNRFNDLPNDYAGERGGFLGTGSDPWLVRPDLKTDLTPRLSISLDVPVARLAEREALKNKVDTALAGWGDTADVYDRLHRNAFEFAQSRHVRRAFELAQEPEPLRAAYGPHPFGQGLLLARRLVEAGTTLVQVNWHDDGSDVKSPFWDTHKDNFGSLKNRLLPPVDAGLSTLLIDLDSRGLLDQTLVLVMGEFGRTPRIGQVVMNAATDKSGRDHWPHAYTVLAAGAGLPRGAAHGRSDDKAGHVVDGPISPPDLQATVLHLLGIDPASRLVDRRGQVHRASTGRVVTEIL